MVCLALVVVTGALLTGCKGKDDAEASDNKKPLVLTTFTVIKDLAQNVAGDHLQVESITNPDEEIHNYNPKPEDIKRVEKAQLVLNNGLGLERWFEKFMQHTKAKSVEISKGVTPIPIASGDYKGKANPHAWMSPKEAQIYIKNIVKAFSQFDPAHAADYEKNGAAYGKKIAQIGTEAEAQLAKLPSEQRVLVTCEGAFSYLARDTGLKEKYLWAVNAEGALTPKDVSELENYVKANRVPAVFCESTGDNRMKSIVEATGAKFGGVLYVDSLSGTDGPVPTYLDLLKYDADLIVKAMAQK